MKKRSKKYTEAIAKIDKTKVYTKEEAVKLYEVLLMVQLKWL